VAAPKKHRRATIPFKRDDFVSMPIFPPARARVVAKKTRPSAGRFRRAAQRHVRA
jgi:hypothetical protein